LNSFFFIGMMIRKRGGRDGCPVLLLWVASTCFFGGFFDGLLKGWVLPDLQHVISCFFSFFARASVREEKVIRSVVYVYSELVV
jgi:hypothetical protein